MQVVQGLKELAFKSVSGSPAPHEAVTGGITSHRVDPEMPSASEHASQAVGDDKITLANKVRKEELQAKSALAMSLLDMSEQAVPSQMGSTWHREAQKIFGQTETLYHTRLPRAVERLVLPQSAVNENIRSERVVLRKRLAEVEATMKHAQAVEASIHSMEGHIIESASRKDLLPPPEISHEKFAEIERTLIDLVVSLAVKKPNLKIAATAPQFSEDFSDGAKWHAAWKSVERHEPMQESQIALKRVRKLGDSYFAARLLGQSIALTGHGKLSQLIEIKRSLTAAYPEHAQVRIKPVVTEIQASIDAAAEALTHSAEADSKSAAIGHANLSHFIAKRAARSRENAKAIDHVPARTPAETTTAERPQA